MNEEYLTKSMESFQEKLHGYLSAYFVDNSGAVTKREDCFETIIPLALQQLAEDMTDEIVTYLHFHVLYARTSDDGSVYHVALYSRPFEHEMAVVMMDSLQHGLIDSIRVQFFDSLDTMFRHVRQLWLDSLFFEGILLEGVGQEAEIVQDFF